MPRTCTICNRPDRDAIEHAVVTGGSMRDIAGRYGVSKSSLYRHLEPISPPLRSSGPRRPTRTVLRGCGSGSRTSTRAPRRS
jgi:hypothetical protein